MTTTCILYGAIEEFVFTGRKVVRMVHFRAIQLEKAEAIWPLSDQRLRLRVPMMHGGEDKMRRCRCVQAQVPSQEMANVLIQ